MINTWREYIKTNHPPRDEVEYDWITALIGCQAIEQKLNNRRGYTNGLLLCTHEEFIKKITDFGGQLQFEQRYLNGSSLGFVWDESVSLITKTSDNYAFSWNSNNEAAAVFFRELEKSFKEEKLEGRVYVLVPSQHGLVSKSIGIGGVPLIEDNYNEDTLEGYRTVVKDIKALIPLGRLSIFDGPPGTGKTYLVRALLSALPDVKFLLLPSNMADSLSGPELLSALIEESQNTRPFSTNPFTNPLEENKGEDKAQAKQPLVLIIEDADRCLVKRDDGNVSAISSILNLSDGIIGNLLDLRIICTTNANIESIDSAITRTGRLTARVEVNLLTAEKAKKVYEREDGAAPQSWNQKFYSLSDVYAMAKGKDLEESEYGKKKNKVGFAAG